MPTTGTYYFDGSSLADSTSVFTDSELLTLAPDGYYSIGSIYRLQTGGVLGPVTTCPACIPACGTLITPEYQLYENAGTYNVTVDLSSATGAVIVRVNPWSSNVKFQWTYDGTTASEYSSNLYGYLQGVIGIENPTTGDCSALPMDNATGSNTATLAGNVYNYNTALSQWDNTGTAVTLGPYANQAAGGVSFTTTEPGNTYMVIPKPNASPSTASFQIDITCLYADFDLEVFCPAELTGVVGTTTSHSSCSQVCSAAFDTVYYTVPVAGTPGAPAVNDWIFADPNAVTPLADAHWGVEVNGVPHCALVANGVITQLTAC
jgi:hypothetical protein